MALPGERATPHLPQPAPIESYGNGGFRFGGMSHRGSLLCLPDGIWAWPITDIAQLDDLALTAVFDHAASIDIFLLGCGVSLRPLPASMIARFRASAISAEAMSTGNAIRTYNIVLGERRRVAAALIAVQ